MTKRWSKFTFNVNHSCRKKLHTTKQICLWPAKTVQFIIPIWNTKIQNKKFQAEMTSYNFILILPPTLPAKFNLPFEWDDIKQTLDRNTVNPLLFACEKFPTGSLEPHHHKCFSPRTHHCLKGAITTWESIPVMLGCKNLLLQSSLSPIKSSQIEVGFSTLYMYLFKQNVNMVYSPSTKGHKISKIIKK